MSRERLLFFRLGQLVAVLIIEEWFVPTRKSLSASRCLMNGLHSKLHKTLSPSPYGVGWENRTCSATVPYCRLCNLNVYNISWMRGQEAEALLTGSEDI
jgi:hypothetical protein